MIVAENSHIRNFPHQTQDDHPPQIALRDYQEQALEAIAASRDRGRTRVLVQLPTGAGKTVVFAHLIKQFLSEGDRS